MGTAFEQVAKVAKAGKAAKVGGSKFSVVAARAVMSLYDRSSPADRAKIEKMGAKKLEKVGWLAVDFGFANPPRVERLQPSLSRKLDELRKVMESGRFDPSEPEDSTMAWLSFDRWYKKTGKKLYPSRREAERQWKRGGLSKLGPYPGRRALESKGNLVQRTKAAREAVLDLWNDSTVLIGSRYGNHVERAYDELAKAYEIALRER
jgi:hypothetical protein